MLDGLVVLGTRIWGAVRLSLTDLPPVPPNIERAGCRPHLHAETLREQTPPAQGSISGIFALSLMVMLSWVKGRAGQGPPSTGGQPLRTRNCATTLVNGSGFEVFV
jgi:hypothetical protein